MVAAKNAEFESLLRNPYQSPVAQRAGFTPVAFPSSPFASTPQPGGNMVFGVPSTPNVGFGQPISPFGVAAGASPQSMWVDLEKHSPYLCSSICGSLLTVIGFWNGISSWWCSVSTCSIRILLGYMLGVNCVLYPLLSLSQTLLLAEVDLGVLSTQKGLLFQHQIQVHS